MFIFISKKPPYKGIWPLSTFRGACFLKISVTEAYILKPDILVIALFAMFWATVNSNISPFIILLIFNYFQVHLKDHVPVNEIYIFSVSHLKIVTAV